MINKFSRVETMVNKILIIYDGIGAELRAEWYLLLFVYQLSGGYGKNKRK